ncbi:sensor histidine kinase [Pseudooceanicola sp. C21-150M6]|uniref:sensor histidine kinase n=1 Tax=Pseudooceanicola sp. C21-150M6 TaxID=3434355 RepID=UPI003D7F8092
MGVNILDRLGVRVVAMLSIALLPIGLISLYQTNSVVKSAAELTRSAYLGQTLSATERQSDLIHEGFASARVLGGALLPIRADTTACSELLQGFIRSHPAFSLAMFIRASGVSVCNSRNQPSDVRKASSFVAMQADPRPMMKATERGLVSQQSVMVIAQPIFEGGKYLGYVALSLPRANARFEPEFAGPTQPIDLITINATGEVLLSMSDLEVAERRLPAFRDLNSQLYRQFNGFRALDADGNAFVYSVTPIVPGVVFAVSVWPETNPEASAFGRSAVAFPLLMWLVSLVVAYFAVHRLVIRHIRILRQKMRRFGATYSHQEPGLLAGGRAPVEITQMEETFDRMVERITRDTAELENNLHEKNVLLKEVHHRVKNNLQLIASIISMEVRKSSAAETRQTLRRVQDRVLGLATVHSNLYHTARLANLRADGLLEDILEQVVQSALPEEGTARVSMDIEEVVLSPDQAVPLSLLATETVTNAIKYMGQPEDGTRPWIHIGLHKTGDNSCRFSVENSKGPMVNGNEAAIPGGLGRQLIEAFASQLGSRPEVRETEESYCLTVDIILSRAAVV